MELIQKALAWLTQIDSSAIWASVAVAVELVLRLIKTERPLSILIAAASILRGVALITQKAADILDKIVPQRLK